MFDDSKLPTENRKQGTGNFRGQAAIEGTPFPARSLKAQAAMEYLMTYGWAILVIVIVLGVLYFLLPMLQAPETCQFRQPGFSCSENPAVIADASNEVYAAFYLQNGKGQTINLSRVLCTTASLTDANKTYATTIGMKIAEGSTQKFNVKCVDRNGNTIVMSPNTNFRGILVIYYNFEDDVTPPGVERVADAVITGKVIGG